MDLEAILFIIIFFGAIPFIVIWAIQAKLKRAQLEHQERMLAIEKGVPIPIIQTKEKNPYVWPFIWIGLGLAMLITGLIIGESGLVYGIVPMLIGGGMLLAHRLYYRQKKSENNDQANAQQVYTVPPQQVQPANSETEKTETSKTKTEEQQAPNSLTDKTQERFK